VVDHGFPIILSVVMRGLSRHDRCDVFRDLRFFFLPEANFNIMVISIPW